LNHFEGKPPIAGRYEIREHIATGGMASVYKTWDHRVERIVAIKVLRSLDKNDQRAVERFRREARAAAALSHPNAVTIYDFVEEWGQYFLVMEYINGPTLKQLIGQSRQLSAAQTIGTPTSSMIGERPLVKLTDFGIVRVAEEGGLTNSGIVLGTADYLSPEQARGETLTASSDLYSLGVVMFEMLAGRPPFVGPTAVSIAMQHASTNPPSVRQFNPAVPPAVERIVTRALEKEPEDRFQSAAEMQHTLRQCAKELARLNRSTRAPARVLPSSDGQGQASQARHGQYSP